MQASPTELQVREGPSLVFGTRVTRHAGEAEIYARLQAQAKGQAHGCRKVCAIRDVGGRRAGQRLATELSDAHAVGESELILE